MFFHGFFDLTGDIFEMTSKILQREQSLPILLKLADGYEFRDESGF